MNKEEQRAFVEAMHRAAAAPFFQEQRVRAFGARIEAARTPPSPQGQAPAPEVNWEGIKDYKELMTGEGGSPGPVSHWLARLSVAVGLGTLTRENADEWFLRLHMLDQVHGASAPGRI